MPAFSQYTTPCCAGSGLTADLATWVGLGGWGGSANLLQNGEDTHDSSGASGMNAWWEAIDGGTDTHEVVIDSSFSQENDLVENYLYYVAQYGEIIFNWHNITSGVAEAPIEATAINGLPVAEYYEGTNAEYIDERSTKSGGGLYSLRNYGLHGWGNATVTLAGACDVAPRTLPHNEIDI